MLLSVTKMPLFSNTEGGGGAGWIKESTKLRDCLWPVGCGSTNPPLTLRRGVRGTPLVPACEMGHLGEGFPDKPVSLTHRSLIDNHNCVVLLLSQREVSGQAALSKKEKKKKKATQRRMSSPSQSCSSRCLGLSHFSPATEDPQRCSLSSGQEHEIGPFSKDVLYIAQWTLLITVLCVTRSSGSQPFDALLETVFYWKAKRSQTNSRREQVIKWPLLNDLHF